MKKTALSAGLLCIGLISLDAEAHQLNGLIANGATANARYSLVCYDDGNGAPDRLFFNIEGKTSSAPYTVSLTVRKTVDGQELRAGPLVDKENGDGKSSPSGWLSGGPGTYYLDIDKVGSKTTGGMTFSVEFHCETAGGVHTGTEPPQRLNSDDSPGKPDDPEKPENPENPEKPATPKYSKLTGSLAKLGIEKTYVASCAANQKGATDRLWFQVRAATKNRPYKLQLAVSKGDQLVTVTDPVNGDREFGAWDSLPGGDGEYQLKLVKVPDEEGGSTRGNMAFAVQYSCESATGAKTRTRNAKIRK